MTAPQPTLEAMLDLAANGRTLYYVRPRGSSRAWIKIPRAHWHDLVGTGEAVRVR